jgi:hypothetical protein
MTRERFPFIAEFASSGLAGELLVDFDPVAIHPAIPGVSFPPQHLEGRILGFQNHWSSLSISSGCLSNQTSKTAFQVLLLSTSVEWIDRSR